MVEHPVRIVKPVGEKFKVRNGHELPVKKYPKNPKNNDKVRFTAFDTNVVIFFPEKGIFKDQVIDVKAGHHKTEQVLDKAPVGLHYYVVWCEASKDFAEADSNPSIIIEDD